VGYAPYWSVLDPLIEPFTDNEHNQPSPIEKTILTKYPKYIPVGVQPLLYQIVLFLDGLGPKALGEVTRLPCSFEGFCGQVQGST
jgi:hypothetical protein